LPDLSPMSSPVSSPVPSPLPSPDRIETLTTPPPAKKEPDRAFELVEFKRRTVKKYGVEEINYKINFAPDWHGETLYELQDELREMFQDLLDKVRAEHHGEDKVRIFIHSSNLKYNIPILIPLRHLKDLDVETIMRAIINVLNSNQTLQVDENLRIDIGILKTYRGGARLKIVRNGLNDPFNEKFRKRCIVNIPMTDFMCAARAVVVAHSKLTKAKNYSNIRNAKKTLQKNKALALLKAVDLPADREIEVSEIYKFENHLDVQIIVYNRPVSQGILYAGVEERDNKIFLFHTADDQTGHFDVITSMSAFLAKSYYCIHCLLPYNSRLTHNCVNTCTTCHLDGCTMEQPLTCRSCQIECRSPACYLRHLAPRQHGHTKKTIKSTCSTFWKCTKCGGLEKKEDKSDH
jgi:hypothetical protein